MVETGFSKAGVALRQKPAQSGFAILYAGFFLVDFDLAVINPLLVPAASDLRVSLRSVTLALTAYLLLFGIMQPVHGIISDAVGRVRVMRVALAGMGAGNLLAVVAPDVGVLVAGRAVAGAFGAAVIPVTMAYVGDRVPADRRQRTMATLISVSALGAAAATIAAGVLTDLWTWRAAILVVAAAAPLLAVLYGRLPETFSPRPDRPSAVSRIRRSCRGGRFLFLVVFAFVEGAAMLGFFNFFNAALQRYDSRILVVGVVTSAYGVAALAGGLIVRMIHARLPAAAMFGGGTALLGAGYLLAAHSQSIASILVASVLSGLALAVAQSTIQAWALGLAPAEVRGTAASLVGCSVFIGAAASTSAVGGLAGAGNFGLLFGIAAIVTAPVAVVGAVALARYPQPRPAGRPTSGADRELRAVAGDQPDGTPPETPVTLVAGPARPALRSPHRSS